VTPDVILRLHESAKGLLGVYKPHLFGVRTIDRLLGDFAPVIEPMIMRPEERIRQSSVSGE
jgi:hypothetical protein